MDFITRPESDPKARAAIALALERLLKADEQLAGRRHRRESRR